MADVLETADAAEPVEKSDPSMDTLELTDPASEIGSLPPSPAVDLPEIITNDNMDHETSSESTLRWIVLLATCLVMTGVYYSLDIPAALHQPLKDYMDVDSNFELHFNLLYTVYSFPNVILPFFGGSLVDRYGSAVCSIAFAVLCALGQTVFALGATYRSWNIMLAGRTIYGFGGESICVAYSTLLAEWFAGKELALAFGIALAIARLGSVLNNIVSPVVANRISAPSALWVGVAFNTVSVLLALYIYFLDARHRGGQQQQQSAVATEGLRSGNDLAQPLLADERRRQPLARPRASIFQFGLLFWLLSASCLVVYACILPWNNVASGILLERNFFQEAPADCHLLFPDQCSMGTLQNHSNPSVNAQNQTCPGRGFAPILPQALNISATDDFPAYETVFLSDADIDCNKPFWSNGCTRDYCNALHQATETAGRVMSIPYIISACLSPLLGRMIDRVGYRAMIASLASLLLVAVHSTLALSKLTPILPLLGQGLSYALYSSVLWPSVTLTVDKELTGTAFGTITSIQNIGLAGFPMVVATIYSHSDERYIPHVELFFAGCAILGSILGVVLNVLDRRTGNRLNSIDGKGDGAGFLDRLLAESDEGMEPATVQQDIRY
jgi:MFS family permease